MIDIELEKLVSKKKLQKLHVKFERVQNSYLRQKRVFYRMHMNRLIQSIYIILIHPNIWKDVIMGLLNVSRGTNNLRSLEIALTYNCNAKCNQCSCRLSFDKEREKKGLLTIDELTNVIDQAVNMGAFQFTLTGGEPMLEEEKLYILIEYIKKRQGKYVHLCTNGTLLNEEKIAKLKRLGLDSIEMGFDSAFETRHDKNRIKGSYRQIIENIKLCKKYGITIILNTILTNEKVKSDDIIYTVYLAKRLGCFLQITPCCLTGALKNRLDEMLTEKTKLYFHWLLSLTCNNRSDLYSSLTKIKCPAAREKIGLQPYGDVVSCPLIQIKYGNVKDTSLKKIQNEMMKNPFYSLQKYQGCLPSMSEEFIHKYLLDEDA